MVSRLVPSCRIAPRHGPTRRLVPPGRRTCRRALPARRRSGRGRFHHPTAVLQQARRPAGRLLRQDLRQPGPPGCWRRVHAPGSRTHLHAATMPGRGRRPVRPPPGQRSGCRAPRRPTAANCPVRWQTRAQEPAQSFRPVRMPVDRCHRAGLCRWLQAGRIRRECQLAPLAWWPPLAVRPDCAAGLWQWPPAPHHARRPDHRRHLLLCRPARPGEHRSCRPVPAAGW